MSKIGILKNYGGAGSRHGGAGRITFIIFLQSVFFSGSIGGGPLQPTLTFL